MPEIAFAGRSNVGKSSLLNALTNRKGLARTSNTPGRTQELNSSTSASRSQIRLVDMPGYGFAEAPKDMVKRWRFLINDYLRGRAVLKRALVLVDSRHGLKDGRPRGDADARRSGGQLSPRPDQGRQGEADRARRRCYEATASEAAKHPAAHPAIFTTSSETGSGIAELRTAILEAATVLGSEHLLKLIIGNRAYSSWSMRGWLASSSRARSSRSWSCRCSTTNGNKRREGDEFAPSLGKVPILWDGECVVWDSLAIIEFLADRVGRDRYLAGGRRARAAWRARWPRKCTASFANLRRELPMNVRKSFSPRELSDEVKEDIDRILQLWAQARARFGGTGDFLFGDWCAADIMYAPVVTRFITYGVPVPPFAARLHEGGAVAAPMSPNGSTRPRTSRG